MIKGLGDMASGMLGDAVSKLAGDAAGPLIAEILDMVRNALAARDGGQVLSDDETGALAQIAGAFGVGSPEEVVDLGADRMAELGVPENVTALLSALSAFKS